VAEGDVMTPKPTYGLLVTGTCCLLACAVGVARILWTLVF